MIKDQKTTSFIKPVLSFLLGSGFSIPEGLPGMTQLNQRLSKINESEILIHTNLRALFLNGQEDPNRWCRWDDRLFMQELLEFYNAEIIKGAPFNYETFYDFYSGYLYNQENKEIIEAFYDRFTNKNIHDGGFIVDCVNRVADFNRSYNQLLASLLHKDQYFEDATAGNYPPYDSFVSFLRDGIKIADIKVHTLNHDLFFDWLGRHHTELFAYFSDGYQLEGSPYYGVVSYDFNRNGSSTSIHKTYYVKLEQFTDKFDTSLCLFKLHGSIFNTIAYTPQPDQRLVRLKDNYGVSDFVMEVKDNISGKLKLEWLHNEVAPDFLSGTTNKTRYYQHDPYYNALFGHFEANLSSSELLIVIGYGFHDPGINEYLEQYLLSKNKKMVLIDPQLPQSSLIEKYKQNIMHIPKGVTQVTYHEFMDLVPANWHNS